MKYSFKQYKPTNVVFREATPIDEFHFDKVVPAHSATTAVLVSNPLYMIFNHKRLSSLGQFPLQEWIDSMNSIKSDPLNELRSKVSDDDLIRFMKSRYCQAPCELATWSAYISDNMDKLTVEVQEYVKNQQGSSVDQDGSSDNSSSNTE